MQDSLYGLPIDEFLSIKFGSPKIQSGGPHPTDTPPPLVLLFFK